MRQLNTNEISNIAGGEAGSLLTWDNTVRLGGLAFGWSMASSLFGYSTELNSYQTVGAHLASAAVGMEAARLFNNLVVDYVEPRIDGVFQSK